MLADAVLEVRGLADGGGELGTPTPVLQLGRLPEALHDLVLLPVVEPPDCHPAFPLRLDRDVEGVRPAPGYQRRTPTSRSEYAGDTPEKPVESLGGDVRDPEAEEARRSFRVLFARLASTRGLKNREPQAS
jgi:hypothetical protein